MEHHVPRGCEKAVLHEVIRMAKQKNSFTFLFQKLRYKKG